jgi:catechol 2,3-dioxygenase-like lactoylglutathione lyase family enzyme
VRIHGLHHAQICVPKGAEEQARAFYCGVLGLQEVDKPDSLAGRGGFWLQVGDRQVHVGTEGPVDRQATKAHLAYEVRDLGAWRRRLVETGVRAEDGVPIPGYERFEFRDPFGNRVEFIEPTPPSS